MNYQNGKIYKIVCNETGLCYIGSTCMPTLAKRLAQHRSAFNSWKKGKYTYITSFKILENENYDIILLETFSCNSKDELHARERYYIEANECVNKCIPNRSIKEIIEYHKEYYNDNKEKLKKRQNEYYEQNKDKMNRKFNCECGGQYTCANKSKHYKSKKHQEYINDCKN